MRPGFRFLRGVAGAVILLFLPLLFYVTSRSESLTLFSRYSGLAVHRRLPPDLLRQISGGSYGGGGWVGRYTYVFFGYTVCGEACPLTMEKLHALSKRFHRSDIRFLFVSVDPERDDPKRLDYYISGFGPSFEWIRPPSRERLRSFSRLFDLNVDSQKVSLPLKGNRAVNHTAFVYLVDPEGTIRIIYPDRNLSPERMVGDLRMLERDREEKNGN